LALADRALKITDASGRKDGAEPVLRELARLGWSSPRLESRPALHEAKTTITFPTRRLAVARALARTLPPGVQLVARGEVRGSVHLIIGADSANWTLTSPRTLPSLRSD
jgi:hypothetical protein